MSYLKGLLAISLAFCLFQLSLVQSLEATVGLDPVSVKRQVDEFGAGAKVGLVLAGGVKLKGAIQEIGTEGFQFISRANEPARTIRYDQVTGVELLKRRYRAHGQPDATEARRVVLALGMGKHVVVNTTTGREFHGNIVAIAPGYFSVLPDEQSAAVQIAYGDIQHVEKNLSLGATIVLVVLIAAAVVVAATVAATR
jgi:hypothetical protein